MALYTSLITDERRKGKRPSDYGPWIKGGRGEEAPQSAVYHPQVSEGTLENTSIKTEYKWRKGLIERNTGDFK